MYTFGGDINTESTADAQGLPFAQGFPGALERLLFFASSLGDVGQDFAARTCSFILAVAGSFLLCCPLGCDGLPLCLGLPLPVSQFPLSGFSSLWTLYSSVLCPCPSNLGLGRALQGEYKRFSGSSAGLSQPQSLHILRQMHSNTC